MAFVMDNGLLVGLAMVLGGAALGVANLKWRASQARKARPDSPLPPPSRAAGPVKPGQDPGEAGLETDRTAAMTPRATDAPLPAKILPNPAGLRDIGIALDGSLIVLGSIAHPADEAGHFPCPDGELLRITRGLAIARCHAVREPSGFVRVIEHGSELFLPAPFHAILDHALRFGAPEPLRASLAHQDGELRSSTSRDKTLEQPLSAWTLEVDDIDGRLDVALSAALHGSVIPAWRTSSANYWPAGQDARLDVRFRIDPITRVACYGAYVPGLAKEPASPAAIPADPHRARLDIAQAPVAPHDQFAVSGTSWYNFNERKAPPSFSVTEHAPPTRTPAGLLQDHCGYRWPRVSIYGLDMNAIAALLGHADGLRASVTSDTIGQAFTSHGPDGYESHRIADMTLHFALDHSGLRISIEGRANGAPLSRDLLLTWELLILRFPQFTRFTTRLDPQPETAP